MTQQRLAVAVVKVVNAIVTSVGLSATGAAMVNGFGSMVSSSSYFADTGSTECKKTVGPAGLVSNLRPKFSTPAPDQP